MGAGGEAPGDEGGAVAYNNEEREGQVGDYEEDRGVSVPGRGEGSFAPAGSRPPVDDQRMGNLGGEAGDTTDMAGNADATRVNQPAGQIAPDKQLCYSEWKTKEGIRYQEAFDKNKQELKEERAKMKSALEKANAKRREIEQAKDTLQRKQADKPQASNDEEMLDEEEYSLIKNLKDLKTEYKHAFEEHRVSKNAVAQIEHHVRSCKVKAVEKFEEMYEAKYGVLLRAAEQVSSAQQGERYDPQEMFDLMEADRLETQHPDALAYHKARKNAARDVRQSRKR